MVDCEYTLSTKIIILYHIWGGGIIYTLADTSIWLKWTTSQLTL